MVKNIAYLPNQKEIAKQFAEVPQYGVFIIDEAIKALLKYEYMTQNFIIKLYATERWQNKASILCMPRFRDFTENFRNHRINFWIHIYDRGYGMLFAKDVDKDSSDPWHLKMNEKIKIKTVKKVGLKRIDSKQRMAMEKRMSNFLMDFKYPKLHPYLQSVYEGLKEKSRGFKEGDEKENKWKRKYSDELKKVNKLSLALNELGIPNKDIAYLMDMTNNAVGLRLSRFKAVASTQEYTNLLNKQKEVIGRFNELTQKLSKKDTEKDTINKTEEK